ncbi:hypothetical protein BGZ49_009191 [Haplosporangium sp. Z 27]|nr:hypothetical protein BGZ49_009191 [Haplosporangium sp. Z 27]
MTNLIRLLIFTAAILLCKSASANFGVCIGISGPNFFGREVVGFHLWNDAGDEASAYKTVEWAGRTNIANNGWSLELDFLTLGVMGMNQQNNRSLMVTNDRYAFNGPVNYKSICFKTTSNRYYYGCYSTENITAPTGYCAEHQANQIEFCKTALSMGSDFIAC